MNIEISKEDLEHLRFIHCRLVEEHNKNPNVDYMLRLHKIINNSTKDTLTKPIEESYKLKGKQIFGEPTEFYGKEVTKKETETLIVKEK